MRFHLSNEIKEFKQHSVRIPKWSTPSSVASPLCLDGQSERTFPRFYLCMLIFFSLYSRFFPSSFHDFSFFFRIFGKFFPCLPFNGYAIVYSLYTLMKSHWPVLGKLKLLLISGKKSASLLDHIRRFLSHQFVTWYLRSISKTKIVKFFCPCMSEHMIYIKNVTNVTQTLHQNVTNVTKQNIASKEILTIEFHTKYMKLFVNMLSIICVLLNTKFHQRIFTLISFGARP